MKSSEKKTLLMIILAFIIIIPNDCFCVTVTIDPDIQYQKFEGWGTSLCWWAVLAGKWSEENRSKLIGAIVDPDTGLGYNCFRYNIGGGDQPGHTHLSEARAVPGFKRTENGDYDWTSDPYQRNILLGIAEQGKNLIFEAFSNSPPWWMTISGCVSGNTNGADNLKTTHFSTFADYLTTIVKYYKDNWGITFRTLTPFNEPSSGYWKINGGQEGCGFKNNQTKMIKELGKQLIEKGMFNDTKISAADETSLAHTVTTIKSYDGSTLNYLSQINSHSYGGWQYRRAVDSLARHHKKILWQSESGPLGKGDDKSDITMWMSHVIIQDLRVMKANAWLDWQVCDPVANWMSIELNHNSQTFKYTKRYYMHAAFSRFIRPGSQIIYSDDTNSVAALFPDSGEIIIVYRNNSDVNSQCTLDLSKFISPGEKAGIYRFTLPGSLSRQNDVLTKEKKLIFTSVKQSITTCVIPEAVSSLNKRAHGIERKPGPSATCNNVLSLNLDPQLDYSISIYDCNGRNFFNLHGARGVTLRKIDLNNFILVNGMYVLKVRQGNYIYSRKIMAGQR